MTADERDSLFGPVRFSRDQAITATQVVYSDANMDRVRAAARNIYAVRNPVYISPDRRFAQFLLETGAGTYRGDSEWPNFAGVKKGPKERGGKVEDEPIDFLIPFNALAGALIQANHWCAYTHKPLPPNAHPVHERYWVALSVTAGKPAVTRISQTGNGVWATDPNYAIRWRSLMDRLAQGV